MKLLEILKNEQEKVLNHFRLGALGKSKKEFEQKT